MQDEEQQAEEIGTSFVNGNISWVKKQIGSDIGLFIEVYDWLKEYAPDSAESFKRVIKNR
jgi:hypothetical protein